MRTSPPPAIHLGDGRRLAYEDLGAPDGTPVIWCHGGLSCRLDALPGGKHALSAGVRLIAPDRPGVGQSDRREDRKLVDWPRDVEALANALRLDRFAVAGWSLGGAFASACAHALPDRVDALGLVASCIPADWSGMKDEINAMDRRFMHHAASRPRSLRATLVAMRLAARHAPAAFIRATTRGLTATAREPLEGESGRWFPAAIAEGLRDPKGVVDEYRIMTAPWGFELAEITTRTHVWHGTDDSLVPLAWGERLAAKIPEASLTVLQGAGHFLPANHFDEILRLIATRPRD